MLLSSSEPRKRAGDMFHGGSSPPTSAYPAQSAASGRDPGRHFGYRNLFGDLKEGRDGSGPEGAFKGYGFSEEDQVRTDALLVKVGKWLERPFRWPSALDGGRRPDDNPNIPSGYVYLAQFMAHDLTFIASRVPSLDDPSFDERNLRTLSLNLETIYGGGPIERPSSFCAEPNGAPRRKLRIGLINDADCARPSDPGRRAALARDVPRARCPATSDVVLGDPEPLTEVLIADPRNDDHLIIAQLTVLFHLLHNGVCDALGDSVDKFTTPERAATAGPGQLLFAATRRVVTAVYRDVIRYDLMRRLLSKRVYDCHIAGTAAPLDRRGGTEMPVEFTHAALRLGHAMVRPGYKLRDDVFSLADVLRATSQSSPDRLPVSWPWIINWSRFFEISGTPDNLSRRISPSYVRALFTSREVSVSEPGLAPEQVARLKTLPRRDLLRGASMYMRSVESLFAHVETLAPDLLSGSRLRDPTRRYEAIKAFLTDASQRGGDDGFCDQEIEVLAHDPPLLLFLMLEGAIEEDGTCFGPLGSVILAEVVFAALDAPPDLRTEGLLDLETLLRNAFPDGTPHTMPELVKEVGRLAHLDGATPAFA